MGRYQAFIDFVSDQTERELSRYGYYAIRLQYRDIRYDAMYHAITSYVCGTNVVEHKRKPY